MTEANSDLIQAERNQYAVTLSEELEFLDGLMAHEDLPHEAVGAILTRRDIVREQLTVLGFANADDHAEEGIPLPADQPDLYFANVPTQSEVDDAADATVFIEADDDHEFSPNRALDPALIRCTVCGQPEAACTEEP